MRRSPLWLFSVWLLITACGSAVNEGGTAASSGPPVLHLQDQPQRAGYGTVELRGLDPTLLKRLRKARLDTAAWRGFFALYTFSDEETAGELPAVLGDYHVEPDRLRFTPSFPLVPGLPYRATFDLDALHAALGQEGEGATPIVAQVALPAPTNTPTTVVRQVFPSADVLPQNLLKLYIELSAPMRRGEAYAHLHLLDAEGQESSAAFLELEQELWDPEQRRLTLFFDPGRIKRGLRPHREAGLALEAGGTYRLVIDAGWLDSDGQPLKEGYEKSFQVTAADRTPPDPDSWHLEAPTAGSTTPLTLRFPEPLDRALLDRLLTVHDPTGQAVAGRVEVAAQETLWRLHPAQPWAAGTYTLRVDTDLEDLAGNNLRAPFDVDVQEESSPMMEGPAYVEMVFEVEAAPARG